MKSAFVPGHFPSLFGSQEFCILLISFCFSRFLSWSRGQNGAWIQLKSELLHGYMACALRLFAHSSSLPRETLHKGVVDYFTDRPLTHPRLTVNLILTFCTQFQLFALLNKLTCSQPMNVLNFLHVYYYNCNNNLMLSCLYKTVSAIKTKDYTKDRRTTTSPECAPGNISIKIFV